MRAESVRTAAAGSPLYNTDDFCQLPGIHNEMRKMRLPVWVLALAGTGHLFLGAQDSKAPDSAPAVGSISGRVVEQGNGDAIQGANVELLQLGVSRRITFPLAGRARRSGRQLALTLRASSGLPALKRANILSEWRSPASLMHSIEAIRT